MARSLIAPMPSTQGDIQRALRQLLAKAALVEFGDQAPLEFVALVEEGQAESEADVLEDFRILRPGDDGARAHYRRQIAIYEGVARQIRDPNHLVDSVAPVLPRPVRGRLGEHDIDLLVVRQIVERGDDRPAVHLALIDL